MEKVLLHCCCAPCSSAIIEWMLGNGIRPVLFYCNPNIYPHEEYLIRKRECTRYAESLGLEIIDDDYDHEAWLCGVKGLESEPERGGRCLECFRMRLLRAAEKARELGLGTFTTTLASSRWKSLAQITEAGRWAAERVGDVTFDDRNWRKGGLQQRRNELLRENGFYNQLYCGCEYSLRARLPRMSKEEVRQWMKQLKLSHGLSPLRVHDEEWRRSESRRICASLMADGLWLSSGTVVLYHALGDEVDTSDLIGHALRTGKRVLLPKVCGEELTLHPYTGEDSVAPGAYGIMEPVSPEFDLEGNAASIDLVVVPGVAFDGYGHRVGRGKGYYDRLLPKLANTHKMGICFPFQKTDVVPCEEHDIRMDDVVC